MPFNAQVIYQKELDHLLRLAKQKGWQDYVWEEVKELDKHPSGLWKGIRADFVKAVKNDKERKLK